VGGGEGGRTGAPRPGRIQGGGGGEGERAWPLWMEAGGLVGGCAKDLVSPPPEIAIRSDHPTGTVVEPRRTQPHSTVHDLPPEGERPIDACRLDGGAQGVVENLEESLA
jgi:hypothetical protein